MKFLRSTNELRLNTDTVIEALQQWLDRNVSADDPVKVTSMRYRFPWFDVVVVPLAEAAARRIGANNNEEG